MRQWILCVLGLALLLTPAGVAQAAKGEVTFLFTGDNGGEVSPCG